jgi:hypothetical protein
MKHFYKFIFIVALIIFGSVKLTAQAPDWTKYDCNNKSWNLYSHLDSNQVVAMVFGMGCSSCTDAAGFFSSIKNQYQAAYPGRFKALYMDFWGNTCGSTVINSGMDAEFDSCQAELSVYTSALPMTYLIIAAGPTHSVIFSFNKKYAFDFSDTISIKTAIENYLNAVGIKENRSFTNKISIYPNPSQSKIYLNGLDNIADVGLTIKDINGRAVKEKTLQAKEQKIINIEELPAGEYFVTIKLRSGQTETHKLIKN